MQIKILQGDCIETLKKLEDQSINTCITSPPYWGLRNYNDEEKQLGLEDTPEEFVDNLVKVFREVKRVLRDDGTVWLNLGDSFLPNKQLGCMPFRVALALQVDGWYLRQDIIWHKPNPMPESVKDRCTKAHEYIFLLSKNPKYYFDNEAIKEDLAGSSKKRLTQKNISNQKGSNRVPNKTNGKMKAVVSKTHGKYKTQDNEAKHRQGIHANRGDNLIEVRTNLPEQKKFVKFLRSKTKPKTLAENTNIPLTKIEHWFRADEAGFAYPSIEDWKQVREYVDDWSKEYESINQGLTYYELKLDEVVVSNKRNKRSVWTITTKPFKGAHFATFPMDLIEPCVLAGCPEKICVECNEPYQSKIEIKRTPRWELPKDDPRHRPKKYENAHDKLNGSTRHSITETKVLGLEKQCDCKTNETKAGTVLDPFAGSGTTGIVAAIKNRNAVLCELNKEYIDLAVKRINESVGLFVDIKKGK